MPSYDPNPFAYLERRATRTGGSGGALPAPGKPYIGQVATRTFFPDHLAAVNSTMMRSPHVARQALTAFQVAWPGWYWAAQDDGSIQPTPVLTVKFTVEYNGAIVGTGSFTGAASGTIAANANLLSDVVVPSVTILPDTVFFIRAYITGTSVPYSDASGTGPGSVWVAGGEGYNAGNGVADETAATGALASVSSTTSGLYPSAIVDSTTAASWLLIGNSRERGTYDTPNSNGDSGEIARSIGPYYAYINGGIPTNQAYWIARFRFQWAYYLQFVTHVAVNGPINDTRTVRGNYQAPQVLADLTNIGVICAGKTIVASTSPPAATGVTTPDTNDAARVATNAGIMAVPSPYVAGSNIAQLVGFDPTNNGLWANQSYTSDQVHESVAGYGFIATQGIFPAQTYAGIAPIAVPWSPYALFPTSNPTASGNGNGFWLDANDPTCFGRANFWQFKNSDAGVVQTTPALQPVLTANAINSKSTYKFNGTTQITVGGATMRRGFNAAPGALFAAMITAPTVTGTLQVISYISTGTSATSTRVALAVAATTGFPRFILRRLDADSANTLDGATPLVAGSPYFIVGYADVADSGTMTIRLNGSQDATQAISGTVGNFSNTNALGASIGARSDSSLFFGGGNAECFGIPGQFDILAIYKLEGQMMWKYGLQALLPASHPYKLAPPAN